MAHSPPNLQDLKDGGFRMFDFRNRKLGIDSGPARSCRIHLLIEVSWLWSDLKPLADCSCTDSELKSLGAGPRQLYEAVAWSNWRLMALVLAAFQAQQLLGAGYNSTELSKAGFSITELRDAGVGLAELALVASARDLRNAGFNEKQMSGANFSLDELKSAGFNARELKTVGFSAEDLRLSASTMMTSWLLSRRETLASGPKNWENGATAWISASLAWNWPDTVEC